MLLCAYLDETPNELSGYDEKEIRVCRKELIEERIRSGRDFQVLCKQTEKRLRQEGKTKKKSRGRPNGFFGKNIKNFARITDFPNKKTMITAEQIKKPLSEAVKQSGMSQTELARRLKISQLSVAQYLSGRAFPALDTFANLCEILDLNPS